jgi:hypothetical protein
LASPGSIPEAQSIAPWFGLAMSGCIGQALKWP